MSCTTSTDKSESDGLTDCGRWRYTQDGETHRWTHATGAVVEVYETAGCRRDPYGGTVTGFVAVVRPAVDEPVALYIVDDGGHLPCRRDAVAAAREWMQDQPDGDVEGR
jgi:hypothetical protein